MIQEGSVGCGHAYTSVSTLVMSLCFWLIASVSQAAGELDAWAKYLGEPTSGAADAAASWVDGGTTESRSQLENRLLQGLDVLAYEVAAGEPHSIRLVFHVIEKFPRSGALTERIHEIVGRSIRSNPSAYLEGVRDISSGNCIGVRPAGDMFVDRDRARHIEASYREQALRSVRTTKLRSVRDRCLAALKR